MLPSKHILRSLALAALASACGITGLLAGQREERVFKISGIPSVTVRNISGDIEIETWKRPEVKVEVVKSTEYVAVDMEQVGDTIRIITRGSGRSFNLFGNRGTVDYFITVPEDSNLEANCISGKVVVSNVRGEIQLETISGDLDLRRLGKRLTAKTVSGDVSLTQGIVDVDLGTVSGDINVSDIEGRLTLGSVSGSVRLLRSKASRVNVSTTSGDVELDTQLSKGGSYHVQSHSGSIALHLDKSSSFEFFATTFSGELQSDLPLNITTPDSSRRHRKSIRGTYGSGDASIELQTFSGDVRIISK